MKNIVLIDGNNLMFRSYYATAYNGNLMRNSKDFPTNALYGFTSMINKIIKEEKPDYVAVAFDIGKNFRKEEYSFYKEGRNATPEELKMQMPIARELLDACGIKYLEMQPYEADDIIGTLVKMCEEDKNFNGTIISSDKDLLQLINFETDIKLLKQNDYIRYNEKSFKEDYGIDPINIIDLKALMGDSSDNIPGVKGIGEKTALKLLHEYKTLEGIYDNIDNIKGSVHDKLVSDKENAFMSYKIATIYKDVPLNINLEDLKYSGPDIDKLKDIYTELEFYSFLKNMPTSNKDDIKYIKYDKENINVVLEDKVSLYIETIDSNYTNKNIYGAAVSDSKYSYYFDKDNINDLVDILKDKEIITYDHKKNLYLIDNLKECASDIMIGAYLLNLNIKDELSNIANLYGKFFSEYSLLVKNNISEENIIKEIVSKSKFIYEVNDDIISKLKEDNLYELYNNIELPLINVLSKMEKEGIICEKDILLSQGEDILKNIEIVTNEIYELAGCKFNIASPKQLGEVLFEKLNLANGQKNKNGYKTDVTTLEKIIDKHPIIEKVLEYRALAKIKSTYIDGLINTIKFDNKIHTIFKQAVVRTGRLSSVEPNLQNIPIKDEMGRRIRKAFVPNNDMFLSCDYSQIELRIMAHMADSKNMIDTFNNDGDIHRKVASDIHGIKEEEVTKDMRSKAKAVIFGIIYGISGFGLKDNLHITKKEADEFIQKYYNLYPEVKNYMDSMIKFAKENGYVRTIYNRKRVIEELASPVYMVRLTGERIAINTPIQGSAADIIKMAMIEVDKAFKKEKFESKLVLQIHDELIFDVKESELERVKKVVKDVMENIVKLKVSLKVSLDTGKDLYETK